MLPAVGSPFRRLHLQNRTRVVIAAFHQSVSLSSCTLFDHQGSTLASRSQCTTDSTAFSATQADLIFASLLENFHATLREANLTTSHVAVIGLAVEPYEANRFKHSWIPSSPTSCLARCTPAASHTTAKTCGCQQISNTNPPTPNSGGLSTQQAQNHTLDTWLSYRLSGGSVLITDETNHASLNRSQDVPLLELRRRLHVTSPSGRHFSAKGCFFDIPVCALASDLQAAMVALRISEPGDVGIHMGDVCTLMTPLSTAASCKKRARSLLISPVTGRCVPALQMETPGLNVLDWFQRVLMFDCDLAEAGQVAASAPVSNYLKPLIVIPPGVKAGGTIVNMTLTSTRRQLIRACIEGIAFCLTDKLDELTSTAAISSNPILRVCGSLAECVYLTQFLSDIAQATVYVADAYVQTPLAGIAALAGKEFGVWQIIPHSLFSRARRTHVPRIDAAEAQRLRAQWTRALKGDT